MKSMWRKLGMGGGKGKAKEEKKSNTRRSWDKSSGERQVPPKSVEPGDQVDAAAGGHEDGTLASQIQAMINTGSDSPSAAAYTPSDFLSSPRPDASSPGTQEAHPVHEHPITTARTSSDGLHSDGLSDDGLSNDHRVRLPSSYLPLPPSNDVVMRASAHDPSRRSQTRSSGAHSHSLWLRGLQGDADDSGTHLTNGGLGIEIGSGQQEDLEARSLRASALSGHMVDFFGDEEEERPSGFCTSPEPQLPPLLLEQSIDISKLEDAREGPVQAGPSNASPHTAASKRTGRGDGQVLMGSPNAAQNDETSQGQPPTPSSLKPTSSVQGDGHTPNYAGLPDSLDPPMVGDSQELMSRSPHPNSTQAPRPPPSSHPTQSANKQPSNAKSTTAGSKYRAAIKAEEVKSRAAVKRPQKGAPPTKPKQPPPAVPPTTATLIEAPTIGNNNIKMDVLSRLQRVNEAKRANEEKAMRTNMIMQQRAASAGKRPAHNTAPQWASGGPSNKSTSAPPRKEPYSLRRHRAVPTTGPDESYTPRGVDENFEQKEEGRRTHSPSSQPLSSLFELPRLLSRKDMDSPARQPRTLSPSSSEKARLQSPKQNRYSPTGSGRRSRNASQENVLSAILQKQREAPAAPEQPQVPEPVSRLHQLYAQAKEKTAQADLKSSKRLSQPKRVSTKGPVPSDFKLSAWQSGRSQTKQVEKPSESHFSAVKQQRQPPAQDKVIRVRVDLASLGAGVVVNPTIKSSAMHDKHYQMLQQQQEQRHEQERLAAREASMQTPTSAKVPRPQKDSSPEQRAVKSKGAPKLATADRAENRAKSRTTSDSRASDPSAIHRKPWAGNSASVPNPPPKPQRASTSTFSVPRSASSNSHRREDRALSDMGENATPVRRTGSLERSKRSSVSIVRPSLRDVSGVGAENVLKMTLRNSGYVRPQPLKPHSSTWAMPPHLAGFAGTSASTSYNRQAPHPPADKKPLPTPEEIKKLPRYARPTENWKARFGSESEEQQALQHHHLHSHSKCPWSPAGKINPHQASQGSPGSLKDMPSTPGNTSRASSAKGMPKTASGGNINALVRGILANKEAAAAGLTADLLAQLGLLPNGQPASTEQYTPTPSSRITIPSRRSSSQSQPQNRALFRQGSNSSNGGRTPCSARVVEDDAEHDADDDVGMRGSPQLSNFSQSAGSAGIAPASHEGVEGKVQGAGHRRVASAALPSSSSLSRQSPNVSKAFSRNSAGGRA